MVNGARVVLTGQEVPEARAEQEAPEAVEVVEEPMALGGLMARWVYAGQEVHMEQGAHMALMALTAHVEPEAREARMAHVERGVQRVLQEMLLNFRERVEFQLIRIPLFRVD